MVRRGERSEGPGSAVVKKLGGQAIEHSDFTGPKAGAAMRGQQGPDFTPGQMLPIG
jgi:hypothetical protein